MNKILIMAFALVCSCGCSELNTDTESLYNPAGETINLMVESIDREQNEIVSSMNLNKDQVVNGWKPNKLEFIDIKSCKFVLRGENPGINCPDYFYLLPPIQLVSIDQKVTTKDSLSKGDIFGVVFIKGGAI